MTQREYTPREWLLTVVCGETAMAIIEHRRVKKCPLTARAAKAIAAELHMVPEHMREAAIDVWLNMGWQGFKADWAMRHLQNQSPRPGVMGAAMEMINGSKSAYRGGNDDQLFPAIAKH